MIRHTHMKAWYFELFTPFIVFDETFSEPQKLAHVVRFSCAYAYIWFYMFCLNVPAYIWITIFSSFSHMLFKFFISSKYTTIPIVLFLIPNICFLLKIAKLFQCRYFFKYIFTWIWFDVERNLSWISICW